MKISVIVCAYNGEEYIFSCLTSLINQREVDVNDYEVLIIDDGSKDRTGEIAKKFVFSRTNIAPLFRYIRIEHQGLSVGRNTGLFLADAPIVAYIDQDAVADKYWVSQMLKAWEIHPDADAIGGCVQIRNEESKTARFLYDVCYGPMDEYAIIGANMAFRKNRLLKVGAFGDPFVSRGDETFVFYKMGRDRKEIKWPAAIVFHDWPTSLRKWLRERGSNGELTRLIFRIVGNKEYPCRSFLCKRGVLCLLAISAIMLISVNIWLVFLCLSGLFAVKVVRHKTYRLLRRKHSPGRAFGRTLQWLLLGELGMWKFCIGWVRGSKLPLNREKAMKGTVSDQYVVETVSNF